MFDVCIALHRALIQEDGFRTMLNIRRDLPGITRLRLRRCEAVLIDQCPASFLDVTVPRDSYE